MTQRILSRVLGQDEVEQVAGGIPLPTDTSPSFTKVGRKRVQDDTDDTNPEL